LNWLVYVKRGKNVNSTDNLLNPLPIIAAVGTFQMGVILKSFNSGILKFETTKSVVKCANTIKTFWGYKSLLLGKKGLSQYQVLLT
jgi:hypothetical protein